MNSNLKGIVSLVLDDWIKQTNTFELEAEFVEAHGSFCWIHHHFEFSAWKMFEGNFHPINMVGSS